jgi:hypothetical protein
MQKLIINRAADVKSVRATNVEVIHMIVLFYMIAINIIVVTFFLLLTEKHLSKIELFVCWLFSSIPVQNFAALKINFSLITLSDEKALQWAYSLNRSFLIPFTVVWFVNRYIAAETKKSKLFILSFFTLVLTSIQQLNSIIGLFEQKYSLWWSVPVWFIILVSSIIFMKFFHRKLKKKTREVAYDME